MTFKEFNQLKPEVVKTELLKCCGSKRWVEAMVEHFPFPDANTLFQKATLTWYDECKKPDWLEAFQHHPKIGEVESLQKKFTSTKEWASVEQAGVNAASRQTIEKLAKANLDYEEKFGFIFIVCATGKNAGEMLQLAEARLKNDPESELQIAMGEQQKITLIRLQKLIGDISINQRSQITTHVLDTSKGYPGAGIVVRLQNKRNGQWQSMAVGITDNEGRVGDLLPAWKTLPQGNYQIIFETGDYFKKSNAKGFYPEVCIQFTIFDDGHYHVPLLLNPFGYSTYRGS